MIVLYQLFVTNFLGISFPIYLLASLSLGIVNSLIGLGPDVGGGVKCQLKGDREKIYIFVRSVQSNSLAAGYDLLGQA